MCIANIKANTSTCNSGKRHLKNVVKVDKIHVEESHTGIKECGCSLH
jgi:hypothetical protein